MTVTFRIEFINPETETNSLLESPIYKYYSVKKNYNGDLGFDLYCPYNLTIPKKAISFKIHLGIKANLYDYRGPDGSFAITKIDYPYMIVPRSSMGLNTPLRLSNSVGVIDGNYRGELIGIVDNISNNSYTIKEGDRLFQVVAFSGKEIQRVEFADLDDKTARHVSGFGSTGK
jgi:dUTP pyrophosphatase